METNETILARKVVGLDDRKVLGNVNELRVDCDSRAVSHCIVGSASTNAPLALPFSSTLSVGDTFVTVQSRAAFLGSGTAEERAVVKEGFQLVGAEVYSRTGNRLGSVRSYEFDPVFGTVERMLLDDGAAFDAASFVFFAPEFVFVDDGGTTAAELRMRAQAGEGVPGADGGRAVQDAAAPGASEPKVADDGPASVAQGGPVDPADDDDAALIEFLVGKTLAEEVKSADGAFAFNKGTHITREIVDEARAHDALLLLTIGVEA